MLCAQALRSETPNYYCCSRTVLCGALYTACVDASRTVFWDRSLTDRVALVMSGTCIPEKSTFHEGLQLGLNSVLGLSMLNAVE